jgi:hypothetical protein
LPTPPPGSLLIDFNSQAAAGSGKTDYPSPYDEDGFRVTAETDSFGLWQNSSPNYPGSPAYFENNGFSTTLQRIDGGPFDLISIKLSELIDGAGSNWQVTFVGTHTNDTTTAPAVFTLDGTFGFETFTLPGDFTDLKSVTWSDILPPSFGNTSQYDDIAVLTAAPTATPTPTAVATPTPTATPAGPTPTATATPAGPTPTATATPAGPTPTAAPTATPAPTTPPGPAGTVAMCRIKKNGIQKTVLVKLAKVQKKLDQGLTLGECPFPANGVVMCTEDKKGNPKNIIVPEEKKTKMLGKGATLGECGAP